MSRSICWITIVAMTLATVSASEPDEIEFERSIRPIFLKHCTECHGSDESNGGLRLDHPAGAFVQGDSGATSIVPRDTSASELIARVKSDDENTRMPPDGDRLTKAEIEALTKWIRSGAEWPNGDRDETVSKSSSHWAFRAIPHPKVPGGDAWSNHPIDRFLQDARHAADVQTAQDAEPRIVLRRLSYDLHGLPPSLEEIRSIESSWEQDGAGVATRRVIDRMLEQPEYGERWGRHWMDWVRYADTAGDNSDFPIPQAYLYRNYIIDSLNDDVPYDQFLVEQLAGDLLPASSQEERNRNVIATGYLAMARRFGSLIETYPWHLTIEDTIDNIGRTMMGMTLACARCHDHKFDPVSTREYYGLYGFFSSTRYPFPGIELFKAQHHFTSLLPPEETEKHLADTAEKTQELQERLEKQLEACRVKAEENARKHSGASINEQRRMYSELQDMLFKGRKIGEELAKHLKAIPEYPTAYAVMDEEPADAAIQVKGQPDRPGAVVPRQFPKVLGGFKLPDEVARDGSGRLELARWIASAQNPLTARVIVNRVWQRYFGRGIVPTTTDFGLRGQVPDHPELLDWLARDFIEHGWSLKHLHRRILTSRTYRLSSNRSLSQQDPDNVLLTHQTRKRLDAESIRDTILLLSGQLDPTPMNEPHPFPAREKWGFTQHKPFADAYESNKRSVYLMMKRLTADRFFQTFDGPDRNACTQSRDQSITALQALYFVNNDFLHRQAEQLVSRVLSDGVDDQRLDNLFGLVLQRLPTNDERRMLMEHLQVARSLSKTNESTDEAANVQAWSSLVRSLFRLNEFVFVD